MCEYGERWEIGYEYWTDSTKGHEKNINKPIRTREVTKSHCEDPTVTLKDGESDKCPWTIGFDITVTPEIGLSLYALLNAYLQVPVTVQLFGIFPESRAQFIRPQIQVHEWDFCTAKTWGMSLWYQLDIEVKLGAKFEIQDLYTMAKNLVKSVSVSHDFGDEIVKLDRALTCLVFSQLILYFT